MAKSAGSFIGMFMGHFLLAITSYAQKPIEIYEPDFDSVCVNSINTLAFPHLASNPKHFTTEFNETSVFPCYRNFYSSSYEQLGIKECTKKITEGKNVILESYVFNKGLLLSANINDLFATDSTKFFIKYAYSDHNKRVKATYKPLGGKTVKVIDSVIYIFNDHFLLDTVKRYFKASVIVTKFNYDSQNRQIKSEGFSFSLSNRPVGIDSSLSEIAYKNLGREKKTSEILGDACYDLPYRVPLYTASGQYYNRSDKELLTASNEFDYGFQNEIFYVAGRKTADHRYVGSNRNLSNGKLPWPPDQVGIYDDPNLQREIISFNTMLHWNKSGRLIECFSSSKTYNSPRGSLRETDIIDGRTPIEYRYHFCYFEDKHEGTIQLGIKPSKVLFDARGLPLHLTIDSLQISFNYKN